MDAGAGAPDAGDGGGGIDPGPDVPEMPDPGPSPVADVLYVGRFDDSDPGAVRLSWSGSGFVVRFRGTGARATFRGGRYFTVVVDGDVWLDPLAVPRSSRQLEIVGDSWSTGDGLDGSNEVCDSSAQDHFLTWGAIAAWGARA